MQLFEASAVARADLLDLLHVSSLWFSHVGIVIIYSVCVCELKYKFLFALQSDNKVILN